MKTYWIDIERHLAQLFITAVGVCSIMLLVDAGQPRTYINGEERTTTNFVYSSTDNHQGCEQCWLAKQSGFKLPIPAGHPQSHLATPYVPATDQWRVRKRVVLSILDVEWRGKHYFLTNDDQTVYLTTNRYSLRWIPVGINLPPPLP